MQTGALTYVIHNVYCLIPVNKIIPLNYMCHLLLVCLSTYFYSIERSSLMECYFERTLFMDVIWAFMESIYNGMHICAESNGDIAKKNCYNIT
jgi:hypothetical protein